MERRPLVGEIYLRRKFPMKVGIFLKKLSMRKCSNSIIFIYLFKQNKHWPIWRYEYKSMITHKEQDPSTEANLPLESVVHQHNLVIGQRLKIPNKKLTLKYSLPACVVYL